MIVQAKKRSPLTRYVVSQWWTSPRWTLVDFLRFERRAYERSTLLVRVFYAASLTWALQSSGSWARYADSEAASPLWPAAWWFDWVNVRTGVNIIFGAYLGASMLALLFPEHRIARAAYALTLLQYIALVNGFFKINHGFHAWFFVSVVLVLLPNARSRARDRIADRQNFLMIVWLSQFVLLFFYTLTGAWKVRHAIEQFVGGEVSAFHFRGFSLVLARKLLDANTPTILGDFLIRHQLLGWALFLATMYIETFSVLIAFRPRLHRVWGAGLILFHVGTQLAMAISFQPNVLLLGMFIVCSPFAPDRVVARDVFLDLPLVRLCMREVVPLLSRNRVPRRRTQLGKETA
jgi:hypothetical protein